MKSDEEKLKELFEMKEAPTLKKVLNKAKFFSIIRNVIISLMILIITITLLLIANATYLNRKANDKEHRLWLWYNVAHPNAYMSNTQVDDKFLSGEINYTRYRFLGAKPVVDGIYKEDYKFPLINGLYGDISDSLFYPSREEVNNDKDKGISEEWKNSELVQYSKNGKPIMKFYKPNINYDRYINDLDKLDEINKDKVMEMSLSFDKGYSMEDIKTMLPKDTTLNWYWVDTFSSDSKANSDKHILDENSVYGIKALDYQGKAIDDPAKEFIEAIKIGKKEEGKSGFYNDLYKNLSQGKGDLNKEDLKIIGVVVSGNADSLKILKGQKYIKAATLGAVADKY